MGHPKAYKYLLEAAEAYCASALARDGKIFANIEATVNDRTYIASDCVFWFEHDRELCTFIECAWVKEFDNEGNFIKEYEVRDFVAYLMTNAKRIEPEFWGDEL